MASEKLKIKYKMQK